MASSMVAVKELDAVRPVGSWSRSARSERTMLFGDPHQLRTRDFAGKGMGLSQRAPDPFADQHGVLCSP
jgi:hypothetical protein